MSDIDPKALTAGTVLRHSSGGTVTLDRRKEDDSGWWNTDGSGLADRVLTESLDEWEIDPYMRVGQLRALLAEFADDGLVVLQKDAEGNGFSPLAGGEGALYVPDTTWSGDVPHEDDRADYIDADGAESCVCLWPVN